MIFGGATVESENFALQTPDAKLDIKNKRAVMSNGIEGTAFKGSVKAGTLELGFGTGTHKATAVEWRGAPKIEGIPQARDVQFRAEEVEYTNDPNVVVYKNAEAIDEDALMRAKTITYNGAKDTITLEGGAEYYGAEVIVSAPKVVVQRKQKKATASGPPASVYFLVKPEGQKGVPVVQKMPAQPELPSGLTQPDNLDQLRSAENLRKFPIVVTAAKVDYSYAKGSKKAIMTGEPKAIQQLQGGIWREVTAPRAEFEEEKEILNLFSMGDSKEVRMRNSAGDDFIALSVRMGTTSGKETLSGKGIEGVMKVRDDDVPRAGGGGG
jgi:lipopolysaccharide export system protein LptA